MEPQNGSTHRHNTFQASGADARDELESTEAANMEADGDDEKIDDEQGAFDGKPKGKKKRKTSKKKSSQPHTWSFL